MEFETPELTRTNRFIDAVLSETRDRPLYIVGGKDKPILYLEATERLDEKKELLEILFFRPLEFREEERKGEIGRYGAALSIISEYLVMRILRVNFQEMPDRLDIGINPRRLDMSSKVHSGADINITTFSKVMGAHEALLFLDVTCQSQDTDKAPGINLPLMAGTTILTLGDFHFSLNGDSYSIYESMAHFFVEAIVNGSIDPLSDDVYLKEPFLVELGKYVMTQLTGSIQSSIDYLVSESKRNRNNGVYPLGDRDRVLYALAKVVLFVQSGNIPGIRYTHKSNMQRPINFDAHSKESKRHIDEIYGCVQIRGRHYERHKQPRYKAPDYVVSY